MLTDFDISYMILVSMILVSYAIIKQSLLSIITMAGFFTILIMASTCIMDSTEYGNHNSIAVLGLIIFWLYLLSSIFSKSDKSKS